MMFARVWYCWLPAHWCFCLLVLGVECLWGHLQGVCMRSSNARRVCVHFISVPINFDIEPAKEIKRQTFCMCSVKYVMKSFCVGNVKMVQPFCCVLRHSPVSPAMLNVAAVHSHSALPWHLRHRYTCSIWRSQDVILWCLYTLAIASTTPTVVNVEGDEGAIGTCAFSVIYCVIHVSHCGTFPVLFPWNVFLHVNDIVGGT